MVDTFWLADVAPFVFSALAYYFPEPTIILSPLPTNGTTLFIPLAAVAEFTGKFWLLESIFI